MPRLGLVRQYWTTTDEAYDFCVVASSAGLLVLLGGTAATLAAPSATGIQVTVAALTTIGTMLSGYIAYTFQRQYAEATRQMSFYYGQPLVHCYLLHAEWLAQRNIKGQSETEKAHLVSATLAAGRFAQRHLAALLAQRLTRHAVKAEVPDPATALNDALMEEIILKDAGMAEAGHPTGLR